MIEPIGVVVIMPVKAELERQRRIDRKRDIRRREGRAVRPGQVGAKRNGGSVEIAFMLDR